MLTTSKSKLGGEGRNDRQDAAAGLLYRGLAVQKEREGRGREYFYVRNTLDGHLSTLKTLF